MMNAGIDIYLQNNPERTCPHQRKVTVGQNPLVVLPILLYTLTRYTDSLIFICVQIEKILFTGENLFYNGCHP